MSGLRQIRLVAAREIRERGRSRAFLVSLAVMLLVVVAVIVLPTFFEGGGRKDVGVAGAAPAQLPSAIQGQGETANQELVVHHYRTVTDGEAALRSGDVDVLVVDARRLEWPRKTDPQLRAVVVGAIQLVTVQQRAAAAGVSPGTLAAVLAPVPVEDVDLGSVPGRSPGDETAAFVMTVLLFLTISTYGAMVLAGVVEEKASRVVEVLLSRVRPRDLLAGKVAGIGLLGLLQIAATALVALAATMLVHSVDLPAVRGVVLGWVVVWFVLGYALYAMAFGALGSLASRSEDAQSVAGPVSVILAATYFLSFAMISQPDSVLARVASFLPPTAPLVMPGRVAMGAAAWWEPALSAGLTIAAVVGLAWLGGRVYAAAILHTGATMKLSDAWRGGRTGRVTTAAAVPIGAATAAAAPTAAARSSPPPTGTPEGRPAMSERTPANGRSAAVTLIVGALALGVLVGLLTRDVIIGVAVGSAAFVVARKIADIWVGSDHEHSSR